MTENSKLLDILMELTAGVEDYSTLAAFLPLQPVPASRPRVSKWGTYYAKTYKQWIKLAESMIESAEVTLTGHLFVVVRAIVKPARTTKLTQPKPDVDNFAKAPLDIITKADGYWEDDHQISTLLVAKRFAVEGEQEGSRIDIFEYK